MCAMKTPGVYVVEKNAFPNSIVEVATAVPAFIGYTEKAYNGTRSLTAVPWRINSLAEYESYFGIGPKYLFKLDVTAVHGIAFNDTETFLKKIKLSRSDKFSFYNNLKFFFANGGQSCYIVSIGNYTDQLEKDKFIVGLDALLNEQEPTIVVLPEAVGLKQQECYDLYTAATNHCGDMQNRITIMDVYDGYKDRNDVSGDMVSIFRENITTPFLSYATCYYPWLNTNIVSQHELSFLNIDQAEIASFKSMLKLYSANLTVIIDKIGEALDAAELQKVHQVLYKQSSFYATIIIEMLRHVNLMPPSSAMAGIYSLVDQTKEVWKAPANISLSAVISTAVNISHTDQEDLNVPLDGKAINAIRYFVGEGIKVWGARTLDGNSLDWRYINIRRTMIMLEESIKNAAKAFVFDPNTSNTWVVLRSTITNFLNGIWKRGGLAGAIPEDAFSVHIGLGDTMTPEDILEGIMRITVLLAVARPAEFIEVTFQQQMQKS
jgi:phage tail sheath protein FI